MPRNSGTRTPQYLISNVSNKQIENRNIERENDPNSFTCIQIGCSNPVPFIHTGVSKIPELPMMTRFRSSQRKTSYKTSQKQFTLRNSQSNRYAESPSLTMKYFGESQNIIGCFTSSRIPIHQKRPQTSYRNVSIPLCSTPRTSPQ